MGKDLNGKELGTGIMQRKDGRYVGRFVNRFGKRKEVKSRDLKELKTLMNTAVYEDTNHMTVATRISPWINGLLHGWSTIKTILFVPIPNDAIWKSIDYRFHLHWGK